MATIAPRTAPHVLHWCGGPRPCQTRIATPDVIANLGRGLPFASACADFIYTESFIEELSLTQGRDFLRECRRIIKPGGVMRLLTADLEKFARSHLQQPDWLVETWDITTGVPRDLDIRWPERSISMYFECPPLP
jgi:predicted SAM-dependent methyltransferase